MNYLLIFILILNIALGFSIIFLERKDASATWAWLMVLLFIPVLGFSIIVDERKDSSATWAWLMVLLFIPVLGFVLYLIFGRRLSNQRIFTWDTKSRLGVKRAVKSQIQAIETDRFTLKDDALMAY